MKTIEIGGQVPTNGAASTLELSVPYIAQVQVTGAADFLFHRWNAEAVDEKAKSAKGSKAKKTDDIESYVYRDDKGFLCIPGEYFRMSLVNAAKFRQDPRSPRKSAMDLYKAGIVPLTNLASLGTKEWDYEDRRKVVIQRNGVNRTRPAMKVGWKVEFQLMVNLPEYIPIESLREALGVAGRLIGVGDYRPTYGRFDVTGFSLLS